MELSHSTPPDPAIAESLSTIEFDVESESFRATHDGARDSTSLAVVSVVATALDRAPRSLTPLQFITDTDALEEQATESSTRHGTGDAISFRYEGFEITVFGDGTIEADPTENT